MQGFYASGHRVYHGGLRQVYHPSGNRRPLHIYEVTLDREKKPVFRSGKGELETILKRG